MEYVTETTHLLWNLLKYYEQSSLSVKQKLIGSIYAVGILIFEESEYRTTELNEAIVQIHMLGEDYERLKKDWLPIMEASPNK